MSFISPSLFCRVLLNLHEVFTLSAMTACKDLFCPPVWYMICIKLNHLLLVVNSSVNIFIYCVMGDKFRSIPKWTLGCVSSAA